MTIRRPGQPRLQPIPEIAEKARGRTRAVNVQATMAHHRGLARSLGGLFNTILNEGTTPRRQRELVILRMGWDCQAEYEFGQHTIYGREAGGLTDTEIYHVTRPLNCFAWADDDRCLLQMVDDLHANDAVSDETWAEMAARWEPAEILEFITTALGYRVVSGILNSVGVELDEGVPGWPAPPE
jgi:hypothetical protein